MLLLNLILIIEVTFSTPTPDFTPKAERRTGRWLLGRDCAREQDQGTPSRKPGHV